MNDDERKIQNKIRNGIIAGDINAVLELIDDKQLGTMTVFGSWLHVAAKHGRLEIVKRLVVLGANINVRGGIMGGTALNLAALEGHIDIVRYLLSQGATLDTQDPAWNPLFSAIQGGYIDIAALLIDHGIDTKRKYMGTSGKEKDARSFAVDQGKPEIAALLEKV